MSKIGTTLNFVSLNDRGPIYFSNITIRVNLTSLARRSNRGVKLGGEVSKFIHQTTARTSFTRKIMARRLF